MSYENPLYISYTFAANDYGNGNVTRKIRPPAGRKSGHIADIHLAATEAFNAVTTQARAQCGIAGNLGKYADLPIGTLAANAALSAGDVANSLKASFDLGADSVTEITVTLLAPTGGTPAGIADTTITVAWD